MWSRCNKAGHNRRSRNRRGRRFQRHRDIPSSGNGLQSASTSNIDPVIVKAIIEGDVPKEEVTVSVVIPTKNGGEDFRRALATIANQKGFRKVEIIVVDSGSTDKTVEVAEQFGAKIIKILPEEFSHSYARNLGASYASGEYLLFTVQDALPPSDSWLYELFSVIKTQRRCSRVVCRISLGER